MQNNEHFINEKLGTYFESLIGFDQKKFYVNEIYRRNTLNIKLLDDD